MVAVAEPVLLCKHFDPNVWRLVHILFKVCNLLELHTALVVVSLLDALAKNAYSWLKDGAGVFDVSTARWSCVFDELLAVAPEEDAVVLLWAKEIGGVPKMRLRSQLWR
eukprot:m.19034 g.19034  ORF g.19034 m.19034 type:complete len:109 (+) comp10293_c0_seq3:496-822(+)